MKNTLGTHLSVTLFGESHGEAVSCVLDGLCPGLSVDEGRIAAFLTLRRPCGGFSTARREPDQFRIVSGVYRGKTTGTPLCILIPNERQNSADYAGLNDLPRPGHADFSARCKYHGFEDPRGGGHFSGRLTAPLVAAGAIAVQALERRGIVPGTHVLRCAGVSDRAFSDLKQELPFLNTQPFPVLDEAAAEEMKAAILAASQAGDSVGGVLETAVLGLPAGVGEPWFDTLEGLLSHALFSIPAVKGVEFGDGFALASLRGSEANDAFCLKEGRIVTQTNHSGGINGGLSNGMPLVLRTAVKPTPSIRLPQRTVDLASGEERELQITGRHDPAIVHRAAIVQTGLTALVLLDALTGRYGADAFMTEGAF